MRLKTGAMLALLVWCSPFGLRAATIVTVDSGSVGQNSSIAIGADGLPIIVYRDNSNGSLLSAKCTVPDCSDAVLQVVADENGAAARSEYVSLAVRANGTPVMAWYDDINDDLGFARCPNPDCSGDDVFRVLDDSPDDSGRDVALALDADGRALVAYVNTTEHSLQLARCTQLTCSNATIHVIDDDPVNSVGSGAAMVLDGSGFPVIAYKDTTADEMLVARCFDESCSTGASIHVVDSNIQNVAGSDPDIAIGADGFPVLSYYDGTNQALRVTKCADVACDTVESYQLIDNGSANDSGYYSSIVVRPDGSPVIAYQRRQLTGAGGSGLRVVECSDPACAGDLRRYDLDFRSEEITGVDADMAIGADGGVVISYYDVETTSLKVAKCSPTTCDGPADRLFQDGFE